MPDKVVKFNDRGPPQMNNFVKNKIKWKHQIYKTYKKVVTHTVTQASRSN